MKKRRDSRIAVRVKEKDKQALEKLAESRDVPSSWIIRQAIRNALAEAAEVPR